MNKQINSNMNNNEKTRKSILVFAIVFLMMISSLVFLRGYAAYIQVSNNRLVKDNEYLQAEIDSLNSQIVEEVRVTKIEKIATDEYGMIYPTSENIVYMDGDEDDAGNLAATIRSEAYN